jgi:alanine-glyoxylate transaminase/serine-glyoxylate transaminase/serine-pyruvate transaminase
MESSLVNLLEPGDKLVVCINGVFGGRMQEIGRRIGAEVVAVDFEWGTPVDPAVVDETLSSHPDAKVLAFVHAETSTGVRSDARAIAAAAKAHDCLVIADCVTSLSGVELRVDDWRIDVAYSGSQKCLSCVPGLSPITFSKDAVERIRARTTPVQSWFCDVNLLMSYYESGEKTRAYHHTAPVNSLFALDEALRQVEEETLEVRWERHRQAAERLYANLDGLGLELLVAEPHRLSPLTLVRIPDGVDDAAVRRYLLEQMDVEIGAGLGKFAGKAWRIGLMGMNATTDMADVVASALGDAIKATG